MFEEDFQVCVCRRFPTAVAFGMFIDNDYGNSVDMRIEVMFQSNLPASQYADDCRALVTDFRSLWRFKRPVTLIRPGETVSLGSVSVVLIDLSREE